MRFSLHRRRPVLAAAALAVVWSVVVLAPVVFTDRSFGGDWWLHLWMIDQQEQAIGATGVPGVVMSFDPVGVLAPVPLLYGGTLYALGGVLAALGLGAIGAYVLLHVAVAWAATFGTWWATYQLTARPWASWLPALTLTSAAWFLGDSLGRGGFGSYAATMVIPLAFAAGLHIWRSDQVATGALLALVGSVVVVTGSHNVSLLWTAVVAAMLLGGAWLVHPQWHAAPGARRRAARIALAVVGATMINGWFLVGNIALIDRVHVGRASEEFHYDWSRWFGAPSVWLSPLRTLPAEHVDVWRGVVAAYGGDEYSGATSLYVQLPVLALAWVLVVSLALGLAQRRARPLLRAQIPLFGAVVVLSVLILVPRTWKYLPDVFRMTQFSMRLNSHVILLVAAMVSVALVALTVAPRRAAWVALGALSAVTAFGVGQVLWQGWATTSLNGWTPADRASPYDVPRHVALDAETVAPFWYGSLEPRANDGTAIPFPFDGNVTFSAIDARDGTARSEIGATPAARLVVTNVVAPLDLVRFAGAAVAGRTPSGFIVLRQEQQASATEVEVSVTWPWYRTLGLVVSALGAAIVLIMLVDAHRDRRRRLTGAVDR